MNKLNPCPFCGGEVKIGISDDEGNLRDIEYEQEPWSGLSYNLIHEYRNNPECPIAHFEDEQLGTLLYDTKEEALKTWNEGV